jgi:ribosomal protein S18 acetylase RimI-like enzyme
MVKMGYNITMIKGDKQGIYIRQMRPIDIITFIRLRKEIESESDYSPAGRGERRESIIYTFLKMIWHLKRTKTFLAFSDGRMVGYIAVVFGRFKKFRGNAYISNVSVLKDERGKGIGTKLLNIAEEVAKERNARRIELEVFASNTNALGIYEKLGYVREGLKKHAVELNGSFDDMILMAKFVR